MNDYFNEDFLTDQEVKKSKKKILIGTLVSLCILISLIIFALYELISATSKMFSPNEELLSESFSPDNKYKVEAYLVDINSHIIDLPDGKYDWTIDKTGTD
ncbi:MAG: DUF5412 family protein [Clostridium sp.]|uniref:DUF5412 family protein n=1 Tax=Clostridium sp. TaxID=1506 RepID=UPI00290E60C8|nr:DUF5412 family protein [Clostridium sp.]MDU4938914.1 DUF5412 family protein [Clostridium sp.]